MQKILRIFLLICTPLWSMEENKNIIPKVNCGLRYNLAAHQECIKNGIDSKKDDAFIHLHVYLPNKNTHRLSVPLRILLDENGSIKKEIILPQFNNGKPLTVACTILQSKLEDMVNRFNNARDNAYDPAEKENLIKEKILTEGTCGYMSYLYHANGGFKLPIKSSTQKILEEAYQSISDTAQDNKITSSYNWVVVIGTLGIISFLVWLYKK